MGGGSVRQIHDCQGVVVRHYSCCCLREGAVVCGVWWMGVEVLVILLLQVHCRIGVGVEWDSWRLESFLWVWWIEGVGPCCGPWIPGGHGVLLRRRHQTCLAGYS